jgi:hypothetical protein
MRAPALRQQGPEGPPPGANYQLDMDGKAEINKRYAEASRA